MVASKVSRLMVTRTLVFMGALSFAMLVSGCAEPSATVGLRLMAGDTNQADSPNYNLLQQSDIVELELLVEGPALPAPIQQRVPFANRTASIPSLPVGNDYRVSVFGIGLGSGDRAQDHFFGQTPPFDVTGDDLGFVTQIGRTNCLRPNTRSATLELPDPKYDLEHKRVGFASVKLNDGRILFIGGRASTNTQPTPTISNVIEIFDPVASGFYTASFSLSEPRAFHSATLLPNGSVLVFGGQTDESGRLAEKAELIIPGEPTLVAQVDVDASIRRKHHASAQLDDGSVLFMGGFDNAGALTNSVIRYFPETQNFVVQGGLNEPKAFGSATVISRSNYPVVYSGGQTADGVTSAVELFSLESTQGSGNSNPCNEGAAPAGQRGCFVQYGQLAIARSHHASLSAYEGTEVLFLGGYTGRSEVSSTDQVERFSLTSAGVVVDTIGSLSSPVAELSAARVPDVHPSRRGSVSYLLAGGIVNQNTSNFSQRIVEQPFQEGVLGQYNIEVLPQGCALPESRAGLQLVDSGNQSLLAVGGYRGSNLSEDVTLSGRAEIYFPSFVGVIAP